MKIIAKVFIGCIAFIMILGQLVELGGSQEQKNLETIKLVVRQDMESVAISKLNYRSTFKSSSFFLTGNNASLYYSGANAFGVRSSFSLYADVNYNIDTTEYSITNIRTKK